MNLSLNITYLQFPIAWENADKNREFLTNEIEKTASTDLIVLPETFTTGFSIKESMAETMDGLTIEWMKKTAHKKDAAIMGSLIIKEKELIYNRMVFVVPNGEIQTYNKLHLFNYGSEGKCFSPGKASAIFEYKSWKIKPIICYDLRFPVAIRNIEDYDILVCVANWPEVRLEAWNTLLKARAIENQCYVLGVNRVGEDGNGHHYSGNSNMYNPLGKALGYMYDVAATIRFSLSKKEISTVREKFPFLNDRDNFTIR